MCRSFLVLAFALAAVGDAFSLLRGRAEQASLETSGEWAALAEAETEDRNFILNQLTQVEGELMQLQDFLEQFGGEYGGVLAGLQISATPVAKKDGPAVKKDGPAAKKDAPAAKKDAVKDAASLAMPNLGSMKGMKELKNQMALAPMLAMLKGLYQESKERIAQANTKEEKSKKWFEGKEAEHKAKVASIDGKFKNHTLSEEFHTNETRDETRYFTYWQRCRERQHRQFHTNLKIQHAMMMKTKKMVETYEKALSPKPEDQKSAKKQLGAMTGMPEIVFLQNVKRTVGSFCRESLEEIRKERVELQEAATDSVPY